MTRDALDLAELRAVPHLAVEAAESGDLAELDRLAARVLALTHRGWGNPLLLPEFLSASAALVLYRAAVVRFPRSAPHA